MSHLKLNSGIGYSFDSCRELVRGELERRHILLWEQPADGEVYEGFPNAARSSAARSRRHGPTCVVLKALDAPVLVSVGRCQLGRNAHPDGLTHAIDRH